MKRCVGIALFSALVFFGGQAEAVRAQPGTEYAAAGTGSMAGASSRSAVTPLDPAVIGSYSPGMRAPVAMLGYSPVSLLDTRQWVRGNERFKAIIDGAAYLLADARELQIFRAAPERYLPALGGDCVVHFAKTGERRPGLLRHGVVHEGRLFFLSSSEYRQEFVDNAETYLDADVALDGNCPVCLVELNQTVPGQAELAVVLGGIRYFFPGAQQREMFRAAPMRYAAAAHAIAGSGLPPGTAATAVPLRLPSGRRGPEPAERPEAAETDPSDSSPKYGELPAPVPVAMAGYCPVSLLQENRWVRGRPEFALMLDGRRYLFAGRQQQQAFVEDQVRYVPALGGDCVVTLKDDGRRVAGSVYHAVIHQGRQFLFPGPAQKEKFKSEPDAYANVDLALGGLCAVRLVETGQEVAGKVQFTVWHGGLRYQLAGSEEIELFQKNPGKYVQDEAQANSAPPAREDAHVDSAPRTGEDAQTDSAPPAVEDGRDGGADYFNPFG